MRYCSIRAIILYGYFQEYFGIDTRGDKEESEKGYEPTYEFLNNFMVYVY